jgi:hypothetical protein
MNIPCDDGGQSSASVCGVCSTAIGIGVTVSMRCESVSVEDDDRCCGCIAAESAWSGVEAALLVMLVSCSGTATCTAGPIIAALDADGLMWMCGSDAAIDNVTVMQPDCGVPSDAVRIGAGLTGPCVDCDGVSGVAMGVGDVTSPSNN